MTVLLAILVVLALPDPAAGSPAQPPPTRPTGQGVAPSYDAVVVLQCRLNRSGRARDCAVISETPPGQGFGEAARNAAHRSRPSRRAVEGQSPEGKITFTVRFKLADPGAPLT